MPIPPWNSYISVESADATAERAKELGATVHAPPFDVMDVGRMAAIQDPQGASLRAVGAKSALRRGARQRAGVTGAGTSSLVTDLDAASAFYSGLFGWTVAPFEGSPEPYLSIKNGGRQRRRHARGHPRSSRRSGWRTSAWRISTPRSPKARSSAAAVHAGPISNIPIAKIVVVADPQGAVFALYDGELEPRPLRYICVAQGGLGADPGRVSVER